MINSNDTCANLRLLARQIEEGTNPDFVFCIINENEVITSHSSERRPFELIGAMQYRISLITEGIE